MLYDVEITYIDETHILIKMVFDINSPARIVRGTMESMMSSELWESLDAKYTMHALTCYRDSSAYVAPAPNYTIPDYTIPDYTIPLTPLNPSDVNLPVFWSPTATFLTEPVPTITTSSTTHSQDDTMRKFEDAMSILKKG